MALSLNHGLDFGLAYNFRNPRPFQRPFPAFYGEMFEQIQYAEELGFDTVWLPEHHCSPEDGYNPSVLAVAAAIAAKTTRIKIGTWLLLLPLHNALSVAEDATMIDIISDGRFNLGVGLGYRREEYEAYGVNRSERGARMEEGVAVLRKAFTEDNFSYAGKYYQLSNVSLQPKPVQNPMPLWVGARSTVAALRAARYDASLLLIDVGGNASETYRAYADALRERGRDASQYGVHGMILDSYFIADDPDRAWEELSPHVEWESTAMEGWYEESATSGHDPVGLRAMEAGVSRLPYDPVAARKRLIVTDPRDTIRSIEAKLREAPYTHLVFGGGNTTPSGLTAKAMAPYLERFAKEVIPYFKGQQNG